MIIKVCGMREPDIIAALSELNPDWMGMIFYPKSKRYLTKVIDKKANESQRRVGVFVNATEAEILDEVRTQQLDYVQLHGKETPAFCESLKQQGLQLIKAFSVDDDFDFSQTEDYEPHCDYFLFDTKGRHPGGNGTLFNWDILRKYKGNTPFLLAGGIGPAHLTQVRSFTHEAFAGVDLNSQFETAPGLKNITTLKKFIDDLRR
ncbi:MAG: phosphoribosylanthranilate isomerase [Bacteroidota bacterium]